MSLFPPSRRIPVSDQPGGLEARLHALMLQGLAGDSAAYQALLRALTPHLRAFLRRRLQQWPDDVEDLVQESLLALHNQRHTYDPALPLTAWVQAIARYKLVDWLRRHGRREAHHVEVDDNALLSDQDPQAGDTTRDLATLLALLPSQQQAAIVHTRLDGWSVRDTAQALQMSEASVKTAVHRGLKALAAKIRKLP